MSSIEIKSWKHRTALVGFEKTYRVTDHADRWTRFNIWTNEYDISCRIMKIKYAVARTYPCWMLHDDDFFFATTEE